MPLDILLVTLLRALAEVAGFFLLGQGALFLLAGKHRHDNLIYQIFQILTRPIIRFTRLITPALVVDKHIPFVAFFLLLWLWLGLQYAKRYLCALHQVDCGF